MSAPAQKKAKTSAPIELDEDEASAPTLPLPPARKAFQDHLEAREKELGKNAVIMGTLTPPEDASVEDEEWEPSLDELMKLPVAYVSDTCLALMTKRGKSLDGGMMTSTSSAPKAIKVVKKALETCSRLFEKGSVKQAFEEALALTYPAKTEDYWYLDNDVPEEVDEIIEELGMVWDSLMQQPDEALGIDGGTREAVMAMLRAWDSELGELGYYQASLLPGEEGDDEVEDEDEDGDEGEDGVAGGAENAAGKA